MILTHVDLIEKLLKYVSTGKRFMTRKLAFCEAHAACRKEANRNQVQRGRTRSVEGNEAMRG